MAENIKSCFLLIYINDTMMVMMFSYLFIFSVLIYTQN